MSSHLERLCRKETVVIHAHAHITCQTEPCHTEPCHTEHQKPGNIDRNHRGSSYILLERDCARLVTWSAVQLPKAAILARDLLVRGRGMIQRQGHDPVQRHDFVSTSTFGRKYSDIILSTALFTWVSRINSQAAGMSGIISVSREF